MKGMENKKPIDVYYESKIWIYLIAFIFLLATLNSFGFQTGLFIVPLVIFVFVFLYPSAKIVLYDDHFYYKKGSKVISIKWNEILGIHQDPAFSPSLICFYLVNKFRSGGFFIETTKGLTDYIGSVSRSRFSFNVFYRAKLIEEIKSRSGAQLYTGQVSIFKQRKKLLGWGISLALVFIVPILIIPTYSLYDYYFGSSFDKEHSFLPMIWELWGF